MSWSESGGTRISKVEWGLGSIAGESPDMFCAMNQYWLQLNTNWGQGWSTGGGGMHIFSLWWEGQWLLMSTLPHLPLPRHHHYHCSLIDEHIVMFTYLLHLAQLGFEIFNKNAACAVKRGMISNKYGIKICRKSCFLRTCSLSFHLHFNF